MEAHLNNKKVITSLVIFLVVVSLFFLVKLVNEIKSSKYIDQQYSSNIISVDGKGEVLAVPDIASLSISLSKEAITAKEAQDLLNESITKTLKYLKENKKIEDKDIKSEYGGLNPKYSYEQTPCYNYSCPTKDPKIVGYTASQSITVKIREVDSANEIKTGLAEIGVTDISGPTFSIDNEDDLKDEARSLAIKEAREKAQVLAGELDVKLGKIISYSENADSCCSPMYDSAVEMSDNRSLKSSAPELPKGENKLTSNVTITYEIR